ncbi:MAG: hypothetical protein R3B70_02030 [Polyangiaceae bacterium]
MPDWITLPHLLLLAAPVSMVLAALALAAGERRAKARRARETLGKPSAHIDPATAGERVLLRGHIESVELPCARFEDGRPAAAATVEAEGDSAVPDHQLPPSAELGDRLFVARSARAAVLTLVVDKERVAITGPVDVLVGTDETDPGAPFDALSAEVRERVGLAAEPEVLPGPHANPPCLARPIFRSIRSGARVCAAGVLQRRSEGDRTGYRDRARWALAGDEEAPVVLAYEGAPSFRGPFSATARGVRRVERLRTVVAGGLVLAALAMLGAMQHRKQRHGTRPVPTQVINGYATRPPSLDDAAACSAITSEYSQILATAQACDTDADCVGEVRGGTLYGLEGCYRFRRKGAAPERLSHLEQRWIDAGCAHGYEICSGHPLTLCAEHRCVERPPQPVPPTWRRAEEPGEVAFYHPPGMERTTGSLDDTRLALYRGQGIELALELVPSDDTPLDDAPGELIDIGGVPAKRQKKAREISILFERAAPCTAPGCDPARDHRLSIRARCETEAACSDALIAIESARLW